MAEMPLASERDDEFKFLDHAMGQKQWPISSQEAAASAIARVGVGLANRQLCDARRSADLIRVTAGMRHGHALYRPGHCEAAGKTCHEDTGGKCKQGQERDGGDLRAGCSAHHCHTLVLQKPARDAASAQPAPTACASCG